MENIQSEFYENDKRNEIKHFLNDDNLIEYYSPKYINNDIYSHLSGIETRNSSKNNQNYNYISNESLIKEYKLNNNNINFDETINNRSVLKVNNINIDVGLNNNKKITEKFLFFKIEKITPNKKKIIQLNQKNKQKKRKERNKIREEKKKNMGRKRMNDNNLPQNNHNKLSNDNVIYKMKVKFNKFIYRHLNHYLPINLKLKKIDGKIIKNGNKNFNLRLFKFSIKQYLMNKISSKYKNQININKNLLKLIENNKEIYEFLEETYENVFYKYFLMNKYEYFNKYGFINLFLYDNLDFDKEEKKAWDELIHNGLYNFFLKKMNELL